MKQKLNFGKVAFILAGLLLVIVSGSALMSPREVEPGMRLVW